MVEMSDCGYCGPDGVLRPFGKDYADFIVENYINDKKVDLPKYRVKVDLDADGRGVDGLCYYHLIDENIKAEQQDAVLELYSEATDTTSANVPLTAIGNVEFNGTNPPKHLNGEFNYVKLILGDGSVVKVNNGDTVNVPFGAIKAEMSLGNLKEATWLSPLKHNDQNGCVYVVSHPKSDIKVKIPICEDAPYLEDTFCNETLLCENVENEIFVSLRLGAENRADFGEVFKFTLKKA
jgi:hypothetical protein